MARKAIVVAPATLVANWGKEVRKWLGQERLAYIQLPQVCPYTLRCLCSPPQNTRVCTCPFVAPVVCLYALLSPQGPSALFRVHTASNSSACVSVMQCTLTGA